MHLNAPISSEIIIQNLNKTCNNDVKLDLKLCFDWLFYYYCLLYEKKSSVPCNL